MPPKTVAQLLAARARQQRQARAREAKAGETSGTSGTPGTSGTSDATKPMKRKAEATGYDARVYASFVDAARTAFRNGDDRGSGMPSGTGGRFVDAAHRWGELFERVDAAEREKVRLGVGSAARALPTPLPSHGGEQIARSQAREAYCKGYELWFLSARAIDADPDADPNADPNGSQARRRAPRSATDRDRGQLQRAGWKAHADAARVAARARAAPCAEPRGARGARPTGGRPPRRGGCARRIVGDGHVRARARARALRAECPVAAGHAADDHAVARGGRRTGQADWATKGGTALRAGRAQAVSRKARSDVQVWHERPLLDQELGGKQAAARTVRRARRGGRFGQEAPRHL